MIPPTRIYSKRSRTPLVVGLAVLGALGAIGTASLGLGLRSSRGGRLAASSDPDARPIAELDDDAPVGPTRSPLGGTWVANQSRRVLRAAVLADRVELRVVEAASWQHAYAEGDVRVVLWPTADPARWEVEDLYRPWSPSAGYDDAGRASCLVRTREVAGRKLVATVDRDALEIEFALVEMSAHAAPTGEYTGCGSPTITGVTSRRFERRRATPK
jgi:hypothetical protein